MSVDRSFLIWTSAGLVALPPALMGLVARKLTTLMRDLPDHWDSASELATVEHIQVAFWNDVSPAILCALVAVALALIFDEETRRLITATSFGTLALVSGGFSCLWFVNLATALNAHEEHHFPTVSLMWGALIWAAFTAFVAGVGPRGISRAGRARSQRESPKLEITEAPPEGEASVFR